MRKRGKGIFIGVVALGMTVAGLCGGNTIQTRASESPDIVLYDAAEFDTFKNRSLQDVADAYSEARYASETYVDGDRSTYYETPASTEAPYAQGALTADTLKSMREMTNFYRWLIGVRPLQAECENSDSLQAGALIRNFQFDHWVSSSSKPEDMSDELWNYGADCSHNILARFSTPQGAITRWMNEGYSTADNTWDTVGHRYALISAALSDIQFGYAGIIAIGHCVSYENQAMPEAFAAFPAQGCMPNDLIAPGGSAWSLQLNTSVLSVASASDLLVKVTNLTSGEAYECTKENGKIGSASSTITFVQPSDQTGNRYTDSYEVEITGLTDASTQKPAKIRYVVDFTDITDYTPTYVKNVYPGFANYIIYQKLNSTDNLRKLGGILPMEIVVEGENGRKCTIPVKGAWTLDEENSCWTNYADSADLPEGFTDKNKVLEKIAAKYTISSDSFDAYNSLRISPTLVKEGESVRVSVYRTLISANSSRVYKLEENEDGSYRSSVWLDSAASPEFDPEASAASTYSASHIYNVENLEPGDSGEYVSVYFSSGDLYTRRSDAYVSTSIVGLEVLADTHVWDGGRVIKEPDCTEAGEMIYTCTECGETRRKEIPATGHRFREEWIIDKEATATETGSKSRHCINCDARTDITEIPATGGNGGTEKPEETGNLKVGFVITDEGTGASYRVIASGTAGNAVEYVNVGIPNAITVTVPAAVTIRGVTCKVTAVAGNAFQNCKKLTKVTIGENVTEIGKNAFSGCSGLKTVNIGKNVTVIGDNAFYKCTALTKVTIPSKVAKIGKKAFYKCKKLKRIIIKTQKLTKKKVGSKAFKGIYSKAVVKVPKAKQKIYRTVLRARGVGRKAKIRK